MIGKTAHTPLLILVAALLFILSGCGSNMLAGVGSGGTGGGGGVISKASYTCSATLEASPSSGYLINAVVFLDKNGNYQMDEEEPYAVTDFNGNATLEAYPAEIAAWPVVVAAFKGVTIDSTTMQPLDSDYILSAPQGELPDSGNNNTADDDETNNDDPNDKHTCSTVVINPVSSQLRELMESGKYADTRQAMDALAAQLELPAHLNLLDKETASYSPALQAAAKSISALMQMQAEQLFTPKDNNTSVVDVERYRTMIRLINSNINIIARLNTPANLQNLNSNIDAVFKVTPKKEIAEQTED
ncbi:MAG: hypothetical protein RBR43_09180 [Desulfuromonadaceae bacterium]|jgi:hypothetical protein|nr:hypothetical protein [Desulfuromonadaceae bacterium]